jgi:hypothetical protein
MDKDGEGIGKWDMEEKRERNMNRKKEGRKHSKFRLGIEGAGSWQ